MTYNPQHHKSKVDQSHHSPTPKNPHPIQPSPQNLSDISEKVKNYIQQLQTNIKFTIEEIKKEKARTKETLFNIGKVCQVGDLSRKRIEEWMESIGVKEEISSPVSLNRLDRIFTGQNSQRENLKVATTTGIRPPNIQEDQFNEIKKKRKTNTSVGTIMPLNNTLGNSISNQAIINLIGKSGKDTNGLTAMEIKEYIHPEVLKDINKK